MIGISTASTIVNTTPPITRIMVGSSSAVSAIARRSISREIVCAARSSSGASEPVFSPLAPRCTRIGGYTFCTFNAAPSAAPSRTRAATSSAQRASSVFPRVCRAASNARSSGTPASSRIASVEAKRALFTPSTKRPTIGSRSSIASQRRRSSGWRNANRHATTIAAMANPTHTPQLRTNALAASITWVSIGSVCRACTNAVTTCGTT